MGHCGRGRCRSQLPAAWKLKVKASLQNANFTGGSLLIRESRIVAKLLVEKQERDSILEQVLDRNLFQSSSKGTTQKYCQLALIRLGTLTDEQLHFVATGSREITRMTLLVAILKAYPIIVDFMENVVVEKVRCFETHLDKNDWMRFLEDRARVDPSVNEWSENSQRKMGQVVIRMLAEAGFLDNTRQMSILFPAIPVNLEQSLREAGNGRLRACLRLGRLGATDELG